MNGHAELAKVLENAYYKLSLREDTETDQEANAEACEEIGSVIKTLKALAAKERN